MGAALTSTSVRLLGHAGRVIDGALPVLVFILFHRDRIDAREPAMEVDVGATFRAERLKLVIGSLAADWAPRLRERLRRSDLGHALPACFLRAD